MTPYRSLFAALVVSLLGACAGPVQKIDAASSTMAAIKTVTVIRPAEPKTYAVVNFGHPGMAFGLVGGLVAAGDQNAKQEKLSTALQAEGLAVSNAMTERLARRLSESGYAVTIQDATWEDKGGRQVMSFDKVDPNADAVVVATPTVIGFVATGLTADYLPSVRVVATVLGKDRKEQLYRGFHAYGWTPKAEGWKSMPARTTFPNFDAIMSDTKAAAKAMDEASIAVAESVSADLRR